MRHVLLALSVFLLLGCNSSSSTSLDGHWVGEAEVQTPNGTEEVFADLTLSEENGDITGSGTFGQRNFGGNPVEVSGTRADGRVSLTLDPNGEGSVASLSGPIVEDGSVLRTSLTWDFLRENDPLLELDKQ